MEAQPPVSPAPAGGMGEYQAAPMASAPVAPVAAGPPVGSKGTPTTPHAGRFPGYGAMELLHLPLILHNRPSKHGWFECKRLWACRAVRYPQAAFAGELRRAALGMGNTGWGQSPLETWSFAYSVTISFGMQFPCPLSETRYITVNNLP